MKNVPAHLKTMAQDSHMYSEVGLNQPMKVKQPREKVEREATMGLDWRIVIFGHNS